ncbi:structural maintenance of chromosomes protein 6, putative [Plasmodium vinckei]|uniref:Structural maintenance of chromosomes protein 6, putative n=1 Tax=Plasmodium vinckei TaxID=5860 RepID=A0A6V7T940_PLAVN|nr:structural maintenance of chromosomes protein 6, putative [Plasmodium vinckei]
MHLDTNDSGERKDETYLNTFAKKNEKKRKRNENDESGNLSESNNHAENYEEDIAQINNDFVVNGLEIYDNNLLPDMDYNKQIELEKERNDKISHNKKNTKLMKISTDLNNDPSDIQNELDMLDSSKNSSVSFFSKKTRTNKKKNDKNLSQRKEASNSSGNNSDDSDWLENIIKDKEKGSAKKNVNKNLNKTPRRASNKNDTQELYDEGLENSVFNISVLEDVDIKSFYGTTGKIIKLRIRNFLNHENLELSFNCYKNIIIGKNGRGKSAIAQAVAVGLGSQGKNAGRDTSIANYIKDYDKTKKNLICHIEIFLSNSGPNSFKRNLYGDILVVKRIISSHSSKFYIYGLNYFNRRSGLMYPTSDDTPKRIHSINNALENPSILDASYNSVGEITEQNREAIFKQVQKRGYIENYLNVIKLNIKSPCVYLDQEKGKMFFSNISEKGLYKFFMSSVGLDIVEEEIEKETSLLEECEKQIKQKEILLAPQVEELNNMKKRNDLLVYEFNKLKKYDNGYKVFVFYELLKSTIILFNEYLKSENLKNEKVINNIENQMCNLANKNEYIKEELKNLIDMDNNVYNYVSKNMNKINKYTSMLNELEDLKSCYIKQKESTVNDLNMLNKRKENSNLLKEHLNKYEQQMNSLNEKMANEKKKEKDLQIEISQKENKIYDLEYSIKKIQNRIQEIDKQVDIITSQATEIQKIKNIHIKKKMYIYGYDIYSIWNNIKHVYKIINKSEKDYFPIPEEWQLTNNVSTNFGKNESAFKYEPIGPIGEYIKMNDRAKNDKILSIIEKHLGDIFYSWLVSCYEDKNNLIKASNFGKGNIKNLNIIVTNSFKHINRKSLLQNIEYFLNKINGNTIYSYLNIDLLPTSLLFYLYDNFKIAQTLICNDSSEVQEILNTNNKKNIKSIYVINEYVLVKVMGNGGLHYQPFKEENYKAPVFLNLEKNENNNSYNKENNQNGKEKGDSSGLTKEEQLKDLKTEKMEKRDEIVVTSKKILSYKNLIEKLNESIKKCKLSQEELTYQIKNVDELIQNHDKIFSEQLDAKINEIDENTNQIIEYINVIEKKKKNAENFTNFHKYFISTHIDYLKRKKKKINMMAEEYDNLNEILTKLEKDKLKNDEVCVKNKQKFLASLNKLHSIYFETLNANCVLENVFLNNPFLILKDRTSNVEIENAIIEKQVNNKNGELKKGAEKSNIIINMDENINDNPELPLSINDKNANNNYEDAYIDMRFTTKNPVRNEFEKESFSVPIPLSCLSSFNKMFVMSKGDESNEAGNADNQNSNKINENLSNLNEKDKEGEIADIINLEKYVKNILYDIINPDKGNEIIYSQNDEWQNNQIEDEINNLWNNNQINIEGKKYSDILWKKRCEKKLEITEILKTHGFNTNESTDNSMNVFFNNLIDQYSNEEKSFNIQMKQISDLKKNYDMHLSNIKLRKVKYSNVLNKTKEQITNHFISILKSMNNYKGQIEFDDFKKVIKVMVSINQDSSNNTFMEISSLSGGERSTIQMALLASMSLTESSSFHMFDELDVYMDELTRVKNMQQFCKFIESSGNKQYFFITPHIEITELFLDEAKEKKAKIFSLS